MAQDLGGFAANLTAAIEGYGDKPCVEFERRWFSGRDLTDYVDRLIAVLAAAQVTREMPVGLVVRNRFPHAAAILGLVAAQRSVAMIHSYQSPDSIARDVERLGLAAVIADRADWTEPVVAAARRSGCVGVAFSSAASDVAVVPGLEEIGVQRVSRVGEAGLQLLTSGTTGPPKRVMIKMALLHRSVLSANAGQVTAPDDPPDLVYWPFGTIGVCQLLGAAYVGRPMVLLEKFSVTEWVRAIRTHRITRSAVQPAALRMILAADVPRADLASLQYISGGSGPLDAETRDAFEGRYGIPVLWAYGATEFAGSLCAWTPDLYREFGARKRDSVGRSLPGTEVRIVDPDSGMDVAPGTQGLLHALIPPIGPDWIRTTDLASMDADGFVTLHGRADGAINRGGFKILPETVRSVLLTHPGVRDACVVGVKDPRLGEVPFGAIEPEPGAEVPSEEELKARVAETLPRHHVPVSVVVVDELPRNQSLKVDLRKVAALYARVQR